MGSIRFLSVREGEHRFAAEIRQANYIDEDGVLVSIVLNTDENGDLFEMDFWKVNFSHYDGIPVHETCRFPKVEASSSSRSPKPL